MKKEIFTEWTSKKWFGNPELNFEALVKTFKNPFNGYATQVWIFGKSGDYNFCVHAGAHSDYSYTGTFSPTKRDWVISEYAAKVDELYKNNLLFK